MNLQFNLQGVPHTEDLLWLVALMGVAQWLRCSAQRAVEEQRALAAMLEGLAGAEAAAAVAALPARKAFAADAGPLAALCFAVGWAAVRGWRAWLWQRGETGNPAALAATVAAGERPAKDAPLLLWAQLLGAWLGCWYMDWVSVTHGEPNYCPPTLQGCVNAAAMLECMGAVVHECMRRGVQPPALCSLRMRPGSAWLLRLVVHVQMAMLAADVSGAIFNPALGLASLHACCPFRPVMSDVASVLVHVIAPCSGAILALLVVPLLRCTTQKILHSWTPEYFGCLHPL